MTASITDGLSAIVPQRALLPSASHAQYAVDGLLPMAVVVPDDRQQVAEVMRWAAENGVTVFPRGGGTKLALGNLPDGMGLVLDMSRLNRVIDYQPGDLTVTVEAGITLDALQQELSAARQFVPLESPLPGRATVGGVLSTASAGAMAHAYGPPPRLAHRHRRRRSRWHGDQGWRPGGQERHGLRPEQAVHRLAGNPVCNRRGILQSVAIAAAGVYAGCALPFYAGCRLRRTETVEQPGRAGELPGGDAGSGSPSAFHSAGGVAQPRVSASTWAVWAVLLLRAGRGCPAEGGRNRRRRCSRPAPPECPIRRRRSAGRAPLGG